MPLPLFVCHANCCRSVLAHYLYETLCGGACALSAGLEADDQINDRAAAMLLSWGIDASGHRPRQLDRSLCERADAIFVMGPGYLARLLAQYGHDVATKSYLFADPFSMPAGFQKGEYLVYDPSFESRPISDLVAEFSWFRTRTLEIHQAIEKRDRILVPATRYLTLLDSLSVRVI